jgi:hypothetical protein
LFSSFFAPALFSQYENLVYQTTLEGLEAAYKQYGIPAYLGDEKPTYNSVHKALLFDIFKIEYNYLLKKFYLEDRGS